MICGDISMHTPPTGVSKQQLKFWVSSIVQLYDFLTIDILCIIGNSGHSFDILTVDFLNHLSLLQGNFIIKGHNLFMNIIKSKFVGV